jgi:hypothetical protein
LFRFHHHYYYYYHFLVHHRLPARDETNSRRRRGPEHFPHDIVIIMSGTENTTLAEPRDATNGDNDPLHNGAKSEATVVLPHINMTDSADGASTAQSKRTEPADLDPSRMSFSSLYHPGRGMLVTGPGSSAGGSDLEGR